LCLVSNKKRKASLGTTVLVYVYLKLEAAAWPRGLKRRFYGDLVITIAWSRFNSHLHRTRCCVLG